MKKVFKGWVGKHARLDEISWKKNTAPCLHIYSPVLAAIPNVYKHKGSKANKSNNNCRGGRMKDTKLLSMLAWYFAGGFLMGMSIMEYICKGG